MLFGSIRVHKPSAIPTPIMGAKNSHVPADFNHSNSVHVSASYLPQTPFDDHDLLAHAHCRRLPHRSKSHSDPVRDSVLLQSHDPCQRGYFQFRAQERPDPNRPARQSIAATQECCSKCTKSGMEWDRYKPSAVVKDYAAVSTQNSKFRKHMEDECVAIPKFKAFHGDPAKSCFFGVYDGHGGSFCSRYAAKNLHSRLLAIIAGKAIHKMRESESLCSLNALTSSGSTACSEDGDVLSVEDIDQCYTEAFAAIDQELGKYDESASCGSTAVTCLIRKLNGRTTFHIANLGDSRAILCTNGTTTRLSIDHKATNEDEAKRIRARNGIILNKRVGGVVAVTRAFGQTDEKEFITADPHTYSGEVVDNNSFLLLASDGVTDVFSDEEATQFIAERLARGEKSITICKNLLDEAKAQGGMDNMTAVLICFSDAV